jgi:hypothetical protein
MAKKQTSLGLNTKLELICLCKASGSSNRGTGREYGQTPPLFINPKTKDSSNRGTGREYGQTPPLFINPKTKDEI